MEQQAREKFNSFILSKKSIFKLTYPDKSIVSYTYDSLDNIINLTDKLGTTTLEYDDNSRLTNQSTNTSKSTYSYDNNGNKLTAINTDINDNLISSYSYEYNSLNNISKEILTDLKGTTSKEYFYNESNEISKLIETDNKGEITTTEYEFDIYGNKSKELKTDSKGSLTTSSFLYNKDNQLTEKLVNSKVSETYKYDDNGNLISKKTPEASYNYTYSPSNKLEDTYINGDLESRYIYNSNGLKSHELLRKEYPDTYEIDESYYKNLKGFTDELEETHRLCKTTDIEEVSSNIPSNFSNNNLQTIVNISSTSISLVLSGILFFTVNPLTGFIALCICGALIGTFNIVYGSLNPNSKDTNTLDNSTSNTNYEYIDKDDILTFSKFILKPKIIRKLTELFKTEDTIKVIFEPSKYTYDYTYDNPLILSESYNTSSYKSNYVYVDNRLIEDTKSNKSYLYDGKYSISEVIGNKNLSLRYDIYGNITNTKLSQEDKTFSYNTQEYTPQNRLYYIKARYYDYL